ncbi:MULTISPECIES: glycoside hydrolase family 99-like domain-containing protein [Sphingobacterium]|uniref:glycosyltransferase WbsX family protein n=1 Tax=Sphingobacterium TaxID=28453 RepID=UPI001626CC4A|nr:MULTISPECIES: glycoside hydrolase family 99-like domain-containing protein [Sphingobacterium]
MGKVKAIAFYLPQFHPIKENDEWWGKGFTEWTNVAKAKPMFPGHYQPHIPADLGFYDLRLSEARIAQADLAKKYGISAFCYWHYWFGNGRRILERPFQEVLESGTPDFPFCLAWANETWSGIWHGNPKTILVEQVYPGEQDYIDHFNSILPAFKDKRYFKVDGKPLFMVYKPMEIPDLPLFVSTFRRLATENGLEGIHLVATNVDPDWDTEKYGFDALTPAVHTKDSYLRSANKFVDIYRRAKTSRLNKYYKKIFKRPVRIYNYKDAIQEFDENSGNNIYYPTVIPNWDNSPRSGLNGFILHDSTPELFKKAMVNAVKMVKKYDPENQIVFIKSWNEWAEGNHLEPDLKFGHKYLEVVKDVLQTKD